MRKPQKRPQTPLTADDAAVDMAEAAPIAKARTKIFKTDPRMIAEIQVYRVRGRTRSHGGKLELQNVDWDKDKFTQREVAKVLGGGTFLAVALDAQDEELDRHEFNVGGMEQEVGPSKGQLATLGAAETSRGITTIPGLTPETNLIYAAFQKITEDARVDAQAALKSKDVLMLSLMDLIKDSIGESFRMQIQNAQTMQKIVNELSAQNKALVEENLDLRIQKAKKVSATDAAMAGLAENVPGLVGVAVRAADKMMDGVKPSHAVAQAFGEASEAIEAANKVHEGTVVQAGG